MRAMLWGPAVYEHLRRMSELEVLEVRAALDRLREAAREEER